MHESRSVVLRFDFLFLLYLGVSLPRFALKLQFGFFDLPNILFETIFLMLVFFASFSRFRFSQHEISVARHSIWIVLICILSFGVFRLDIDGLERILYGFTFFVALTYRRWSVFWIVALINFLVAFAIIDLERPGLYGMGSFQAVVVNLAQNSVFFICLICLFLRSKNIPVKLFGLVFLIIEAWLIYVIDLPTFHYDSESLNVFELLVAKFIVRSDWIWTVGTPENLAIFLDGRYSVMELFSRFFSFVRWPLDYFFSVVLWVPTEIGRDLATSLRGDGSSFNIDAASWLAMASSVSSNMFLTTIFLTLYLLLFFCCSALARNSVISKFGVSYISCSLLLLPSAAYQGRDLKFILWLTFCFLIFRFLVLVSNGGKRDKGNAYAIGFSNSSSI